MSCIWFSRLRTTPIWPWLMGVAVVLSLLCMYGIAYAIVAYTGLWHLLMVHQDNETTARVMMPVIVILGVFIAGVVVTMLTCCVYGLCSAFCADLRATVQMTRDTVEMV